MFRYLLFVSVVAFACLGSACSDEAGADPLAAACEKACSLASDHICTDQVTKCKADCQALAGQAALEGYQGSSCGTCIASQFTYSTSTDGKQCYGIVAPAKIGIPECESVCADPDA
jgi:hypothetical protein